MTTTARSLGVVLASAWLGATGCVGAIGGGSAGGDSPSGEPGDGEPARPSNTATPGVKGGPGTTVVPGMPGATGPLMDGAGPLPLRRLTRREYNNTVRDLFGDMVGLPAAFPADAPGESGFLLPEQVSSLHAQMYFEASDGIAARAAANLTKLSACDPAKAGEDACVDDLLNNLGKRIYRRPLLADEATRLKALFKSARQTATYDYAHSIAVMLQAMLQSPSFLYHWEGATVKAARDGALVKIGGYQMASRLSYLFWGTMPDAALFASADGGKLDTAEGVLTEARRLIADRRFADGAVEFYRQWLRLDMSAAQKDTTIFSANDFNATVRDAMQEEVTRFVGDLMTTGDGRLSTLLTAPYSFVNATLAKTYGIATPPKDWQKLTLDPRQRSGLLTQPAFLATKSGAVASDPVKRGATIWRDVLCGDLPPPPPDVPAPTPPAPNLSTRERFEAHEKNACASCHRIMDPPGFAFENYDAIGRYRTTDGGKPVNAAATFTTPLGTAMSFANAIELVGKLASSEDVRRCVNLHWFRYVLGRLELPAEAASIEGAYQQFAKSSYDMRELLVAITQTRAFLRRTPNQGEP